MTEIAIVNIEQSLTVMQVEILSRFVSAERQNQIKKFHFFQDAQYSLIGELLARAEICIRTGLSINSIVFLKNGFGKPFIENAPQLHFNISHTANYVACVLDDQPVGIDIEEIKDSDIKIAERFFAPDELAYILEGSELDQNIRFIEIWTMKESFIKREGGGLSIPLRSFSVLGEKTDQKKYFHKIYKDEHVISHVCSTSDTFPKVKIMTVLDLVKFFGI